jgi:MoaA/NifB/PqqE/SkfB family radical SAM enzyme
MKIRSRFRARIGPHGALAPWLDAQLNVYNVDGMLAHRTDQRVDTSHLRRFLRQIAGLWILQLGCIMEPTLDERLGDLLLEARRCPVGPTDQLILQTNGILLHMHDAAKLREARLTRLSVSIDSADPDIHRALRDGTRLGKVERNRKACRTSCPEVEMHFITTVTRLNIDSLDGLVRLGLDLGVSRFVLREVFYVQDNNVVDHTRMPNLVLRPGDYDHMAETL